MFLVGIGSFGAHTHRGISRGLVYEGFKNVSNNVIHIWWGGGPPGSSLQKGGGTGAGSCGVCEKNAAATGSVYLVTGEADKGDVRFAHTIQGVCAGIHYGGCRARKDAKGA